MDFLGPRAMVPLVLETPDGPMLRGSGLFVDDDHTVMTARHVLEGLANLDGLTVAIQHGLEFDMIAARRAWRSKLFDVAVIELEPAESAQPRQISLHEVPMNVDVASIEYSRSTTEFDPSTGLRRLRVIRSFQRGQSSVGTRAAGPRQLRRSAWTSPIQRYTGRAAPP